MDFILTLQSIVGVFFIPSHSEGLEARLCWVVWQIDGRGKIHQSTFFQTVTDLFCGEKVYLFMPSSSDWSPCIGINLGFFNNMIIICSFFIIYITLTFLFLLGKFIVLCFYEILNIFESFKCGRWWMNPFYDLLLTLELTVAFRWRCQYICLIITMCFFQRGHEWGSCKRECFFSYSDEKLKHVPLWCCSYSVCCVFRCNIWAHPNMLNPLNRGGRGLFFTTKDRQAWYHWRAG